MIGETGEQAYRKFLFFFENKKKVHFCLKSGGFENGLILDLNEAKLTMVLIEERKGETPFLLEDIDVNTIVGYREKKEDWE